MDYPLGRMTSGLLRWTRLLVLAAVAAIGASVFAAVALAIVDLYVTGHGGLSLGRPWISWSSVLELSRADVLVLVAAALGFVSTILARNGLVPPQAAEAT